MHRRLGVLAIAAVAVTLVAAGCGGDDDDGDAPTKEEFISQADEICAEGDRRINQEAENVFQQEPSRGEEVSFVEDTVVPETQEQIDQIRELTPPEGDEDEINAIVDAADEGIDELEADPETITQEGENPLAEASQLAAEYGMKDCGQG